MNILIKILICIIVGGLLFLATYFNFKPCKNRNDEIILYDTIYLSKGQRMTLYINDDTKYYFSPDNGGYIIRKSIYIFKDSINE